MKVVHITTWLHGGAGIAALRLHLELLNQGIESHIISLANTTIPQVNNHHPVLEHQTSLYEKIFNKFGIRLNSAYRNTHRLKQLNGEYEIVTFPDTDYRIENIDIVKSADVIHLHWIANFINYKTFFSKLKNKKIVWTLHDLNPMQGIFHYKNDEFNNPSFGGLNKHAYNQKMKAIQKVRNLTYVCLNNWMLDQLNTGTKASFHKADVIPNIINEKDFFADAKSMEKSGSLLNFLLIACDVNNYRKGFDLALEALSRLKNKDKVTIFIVGKGETTIPKGIKTNMIGALYDIKELRSIYNECEYLIIPSREDNLPNTMAEALLCGTAVISFKIGGMANHIVNGANGFLIDPYNVEKMAKQIDHIIENRIILSRNQISKKAHQIFSQTNIHKYTTLYKDLMNEKLAL
ncbi:glycosyltransferase [Pedobacter helvus]|uniref:Glycosyltransferase n=1 Tax=Pedobacter helvus TaxID=2563444 RepID=A0ABW9JL58_9SPHI|nr:glycosyltransferase [Pedobacter ureilyticus]